MTYVVSAFPQDDTQLVLWAKNLRNVTLFQTRRGESSLWIRSEYRGLSQSPAHGDLAAKMRAIGYSIEGVRGGSIGFSDTGGELIKDAPTLGAVLAGMQVAFCIVGLIQIRRAKKRGVPIPSLFPGHHLRSIAIGLVGGLLLLGIGELYSAGLATVLGHSPPSPWDSSADMPSSAKTVFLLFGALGAPIAEEIFFRGFLFGLFKGAGHVALGMVVSALLFAAVHFSDAYNVPAIGLYGILLAMMYHHTGSLLAPIAAHCVNNGIVIACLVW